MVVSDSCLFPPSNMKVRITNSEGTDYIVDLHPDWTVDKVKIMSLGHFYSSSESMKSSLYHKLVLVRSGKLLEEETTLVHAGIKDNGENHFFKLVLLLNLRLLIFCCRPNV